MYLALYGPEGSVIFDHPYNAEYGFGQCGRMRHRLRAYLPVRVAWPTGLPGRG